MPNDNDMNTNLLRKETDSKTIIVILNEMSVGFLWKGI